MNIHEIIEATPYYEQPSTLKLFDDIKAIKQRGYLTKKEFLQIARSKSTRPLNYYTSNSTKQSKR
jgi:hypothetical protein